MGEGCASASVPYLLRPWPLSALVAAVGAVALPLLMLVELQPDAPLTAAIVRAYAVGLGLTHFIAAFAVYLLPDHRAHFAATPSARIFYVLLPIGSLLTFALWSQHPPAFVQLALLVVRACDFYHVGRQSFGVLQLLRRSAPAPAQRAAESAHFVCIAAAQWLVFVDGGRFSPTSPLGVLAMLLLVGGSAVMLGSRPLRERAATDAIPSAYLLAQTVGGLLAVLDTRLYLVALALHYVEYHTLLMPRLFRGPVRLRLSPPQFYVLLLAVSACVEWTRTVTSGHASIALLDGLFLAHYLVDGKLWRFSEPFYAQRVLPLYLAVPLPRVSPMTTEEVSP